MLAKSDSGYSMIPCVTRARNADLERRAKPEWRVGRSESGRFSAKPRSPGYWDNSRKTPLTEKHISEKLACRRCALSRLLLDHELLRSQGRCTEWSYHQSGRAKRESLLRGRNDDDGLPDEPIEKMIGSAGKQLLALIMHHPIERSSMADKSRPKTEYSQMTGYGASPFQHDPTRLIFRAGQLHPVSNG